MIKAERVTSAQFLIKLGFRQRIVSQVTLLTTSQVRKLFDECAYRGVEVKKHSGPPPTAASIVRETGNSLEASFLMLCYTRTLDPDRYSNNVDVIEYIRAYDEYINLRNQNKHYFESIKPIDISDGFVLAESLRNPDSDTGASMLDCPHCSCKFYNPISQYRINTRCSWCNSVYC